MSPFIRLLTASTEINTEEEFNDVSISSGTGVKSFISRQRHSVVTLTIWGAPIRSRRPSTPTSRWSRSTSGVSSTSLWSPSVSSSSSLSRQGRDVCPDRASRYCSESSDPLWWPLIIAEERGQGRGWKTTRVLLVTSLSSSFRWAAWLYHEERWDRSTWKPSRN